MATLFNNHPYISSSGSQVDTKFTAIMWGWLLNNVAMIWSAYHCVHGTSCLCTDMSAFIEPFIHQLDFFFYGDDIYYSFSNNCSEAQPNL